MNKNAPHPPEAACINEAYAQIQSGQTLSDAQQIKALQNALHSTLEDLNTGSIRVATPDADQGWQIKDWVKKALILYLNQQPCQRMAHGSCIAYDKVPMKYAQYQAEDFETDQVRVVPNATVRYGAYIGPRTVLMPCFINLGAYIDAGCMVDTWATVGSCAQIGKNVHLSGGVGIGGVLEPIQAQPTIIEDNCFIGGRAEIAEGVVVEAGSVIAPGVNLTQSTKIYDRTTDRILPAGRIPAGSVVVPGSLPAATGKAQLYAAVITKRVDAQTLEKTAINDLLRQQEATTE
jgi:2,3,4,5-tetrahydropyridine-2,6-dicarboxylate N-succinyltransferase